MGKNSMKEKKSRLDKHKNIEARRQEKKNRLTVNRGREKGGFSTKDGKKSRKK